MIERTRQGYACSGLMVDAVTGFGLLVLNSKPSALNQFAHNFSKGLILAQNERWRRGLGMQVEREPVFGLGRAANGVGIPRYVPPGRG